MGASLLAKAVYRAVWLCWYSDNAGSNCLSMAWRTAGRIVALLVYICLTMVRSTMARSLFKPRTAYSQACSAVAPLGT
ncbi:hypothetical protein D3C80_1995270 [compost metagenome]